MNAVETSFEPSWGGPLWLTLAVLAASAAFAWALYRRERGPAPMLVRGLLAAIRSGLFVILAWMFYGWMRAEHRTELPELAVVVDVSASMATVDRELDAGPKGKRADTAATGMRAGNATAGNATAGNATAGNATAGNTSSGNSGSASAPAAKATQAAQATQVAKDPTASHEAVSANARLERVKRLVATPESGLLEQWRQRFRVRFYRVGTTTFAEDAETATLAEGANTAMRAEGDGAADKAALAEANTGGKPTSWVAADDASRLGDGLFDVLQAQRGRPTAAVVFFSDGVTTEGRSLAESAALAGRRRVPLHCVGVGGERPPRDVRLADLAADDSAFVGDLVVFQASLSSTGFAGERIRVRLVRQESGAVLGEQLATLPADGRTVPVRIAFRPLGPGDFSLALVADTLPGEATVLNNRLARTVRVGEETLRVLLVQSAPSYEFRYLRTLLQRQRKRSDAAERAVALTAVLQEADADYPSIDPDASAAFPATRDELFRYDVVILGDVDPSLIGPAGLANLEAFVAERGGGLIVCAGPLFTPQAFAGTRLASLLPFDPESVRTPAV
jgi:hypothetical protein